MFYAVEAMAPPPSHSQAVLPNPVTLVLEKIERFDKDFRIFVRVRQTAICPECRQVSMSRHSGYRRRLSDLPWQGLSVQIWLNVSRYRCRNVRCAREVFCERARCCSCIRAPNDPLVRDHHWLATLPEVFQAHAYWIGSPSRRATTRSAAA